MKLLIVGATGGTGRALVEQGLARGHHVTAFVRDPSRLPIQHERLVMARGDMPFYFFDKVGQERLIRESSLDWVIVRPGALTDGPKRGRLRQGPDVGHWVWTVRISRADVASFMLDQLTDHANLRRAVAVSW